MRALNRTTWGTDGLAALAYAVDVRTVVRHLGQISIAIAGLMLVPAVFAAVAGESTMAAASLGVSVLLGSGGTAASRLRASPTVRSHEALAIITIAFAIAAGAALLPLLAARVPFWDALFEAVSAVTSTGLSTVANIEARSDSYKFTRAWAQWMGGLGFAILGIALATSSTVADRHLASGQAQSDNLVSNTRAHMHKILSIYAGLTFAGWITMMAVGMDAFPALLHALTAISTAGFSPYAESIGAVEPRAAWIVLAVLMICGAISFTVYGRAWRQGWRYLREDSHLQFLFLAIIVLSTALFLTSHVNSAGRALGWQDAAMLAISAQTTTGLFTVSPSELDPASKLVLIGSMLIGGDAGSTAGGMKIVRFLILMRVIQLVVARTAIPSHALSVRRLGPHRLEDQDAVNGLAVAVLYVLLPLVGWLPFLFYGHPPLDAFFDVVSAVTTTGLSAGVATTELEAPLKALFCTLMLAGRVEIVAAIVVLRPRTWAGHPRSMD
ncbi:TrkH family potassium uptake protein [Microvirga roseola]|uniref:TrkH family potassium uptake protein n=1 Tax=Microvirga roseola TaxID=2883126 RepID=UPI001E34C523|nr:potassium transporter TrkG [Microvirga roseola]